MSSETSSTCLSVLLTPCLTVYLSDCPSHCLSDSHCLTVPLIVSLSLSISLTVSLSHRLSHCPSHCLSLCLIVCLSVSLSVSLSHCLIVCPSHCQAASLAPLHCCLLRGLCRFCFCLRLLHLLKLIFSHMNSMFVPLKFLKQQMYRQKNTKSKKRKKSARTEERGRERCRNSRKCDTFHRSPSSLRASSGWLCWTNVIFDKKWMDY